MADNDTPNSEPPERSQEQELLQALKHYSEKVVRIWATRRNWGEMAQPDGVGEAASDCQDSIRLQLRLRHGRVLDASFVSEGCGATFACASAAAELARGRTAQGLLTLTPQDVLEELEGLPAHNAHCADLAIDALRRAASDLLSTSAHPWKRLYR